MLFSVVGIIVSFVIAGGSDWWTLIGSVTGTTALILLPVVVTVIFYFILRAFNTPNLGVSTLSITTSFFAASFVFLRSPYYGVAYGCNDIVLIILWILATLEEISYLPMVLCFLIFLINDIYGFVNWSKIKERQREQPSRSGS